MYGLKGLYSSQGQGKDLRENLIGGSPLPGTGRHAVDVTEHNNMSSIAVYEYENMRTESRIMVSKSRVQELDSDPGQDSRPLCL